MACSKVRAAGGGLCWHRSRRTDAAAMEQMDREHIEVRLMMRYQGIFHPKVFWLEGKNTNLIWVGSNNLTRDGLINNIEFAVAIRSERTAMESLVRWSEQIELASDNFSNELLSSYKNELGKYQRNLSTTQKKDVYLEQETRAFTGQRK